MALNRTGITKTSAITPSGILIAPGQAICLPITATNTGITADSDGKKIIKAGTPIYGSFESRNTPFVLETTTTNVSNATAIALHDIDVTGGQANGTAVAMGSINVNAIDTTTAALLTAAVKTALNKIVFVK